MLISVLILATQKLNFYSILTNYPFSNVTLSTFSFHTKIKFLLNTYKLTMSMTDNLIILCVDWLVKVPRVSIVEK